MKKKKQGVTRPRLPEAARTKIKKGGTHKNKRVYDRKKDKTKINKEEEPKPADIGGFFHCGKRRCYFLNSFPGHRVVDFRLRKNEVVKLFYFFSIISPLHA